VISAQLVFCTGVAFWGLYQITCFKKKTIPFSGWAKIFAALVYSGVGINDLLLFNGTIDSAPMFPVGVFSSVVLVAILVNEKIEETYRERDYLRKNLEKEVDFKTSALAAKSTQLEVALKDLKHAQAEMVQSAKLAAVGTLSAGIAHEINNALNYVNGGISPIQNILKKDQITEADRTKAERLIDLMKEGLGLTFGIIRNLKQQVSNQGLVEDIEPLELVDGVLVLLKNQLGGRIKVKTEVENGVLIYAQRVGLSQILMNLVVNAVDAMEDSALQIKMNGRAPEITISVKKSDGAVMLSVADNGPGMSDAVKSRIFEPFFTTKAVGKGTGLGLHIVRSETQKAGGDVLVSSQEGVGTTFLLKFPLRAEAAA
jgi:two-component system NtrC family sensor kinase